MQKRAGILQVDFLVPRLRISPVQLHWPRSDHLITRPAPGGRGSCFDPDFLYFADCGNYGNLLYGAFHE